MTQAAVILIPGGVARRPSRRRGGGSAGRRGAGVDAPAGNLRRALQAGLDEVLAVLTDEGDAAGLAEDATLLLDEADVPDEASSLRVATDWCARSGHDRLIVALFGAAVLEPEAWRTLASASGPPVLVARDRRRGLGVVRLEATVWSLLPLEGRADVLWRSRPELAAELLVEPAPSG